MADHPADPVLACTNAIDHYTRLHEDLLSDVARYQRLAQEKQIEAERARLDLDQWISAKVKLTGQTHTIDTEQSDPVITAQGSDSNISVDSLLDLLPVGLPRRTYEEYQRAYRVHSGDNELPFIEWKELSRPNKSAWRSVVAFLMTEFAKEHKPTVKLTDSNDLVRSAFESWQQQFGYPTQVTGSLDWDKQGWTFKTRWRFVVDTIEKLLIVNNPDTANLQLRFDIQKVGDISVGLEHNAPYGITVMVFNGDGAVIVRKSVKGWHRLQSLIDVPDRTYPVVEGDLIYRDRGD